MNHTPTPSPCSSSIPSPALAPLPIRNTGCLWGSPALTLDLAQSLHPRKDAEPTPAPPGVQQVGPGWQPVTSPGSGHCPLGQDEHRLPLLEWLCNPSPSINVKFCKKHLPWFWLRVGMWCQQGKVAPSWFCSYFSILLFIFFLGWSQLPSLAWVLPASLQDQVSY